jgi:hypothetical protein
MQNLQTPQMCQPEPYKNRQAGRNYVSNPV